MDAVFLILLVLASFCFALSAFFRGRFDTKVSLVPLGLFLWVLVPTIQHFMVLE